jgi:hypothetical protein
MYIGGSFTSFGGETRNNIAALDTTTGALTTWNPDADDIVNTIVVDDKKAYIGGYFNNMSGAPRDYIAEVSSSGSLSAWNPSVDNAVEAIYKDTSSGIVYLGGAFLNVNATGRTYAAAVDSTTGTTTQAWNPDPNARVFDIQPSLTSGNLYLGGNFTIINAVTTRNYLAEVDDVNGTVTSWNPDPNANITTISVDATAAAVYVGGSFNDIGGSGYDYLAKVDSTGAVLPINFSGSGTVFSVVSIAGSSNIYVGYDGTTFGGQTRPYLVELDAGTGLATSWLTNVSNVVMAVQTKGSAIYAGGIFRHFHGTTANPASIDISTGLSLW